MIGCEGAMISYGRSIVAALFRSCLLLGLVALINQRVSGVLIVPPVTMNEVGEMH